MIRLFSIILGLSIFGLDLWSKSWAKSALIGQEAWPIVEGFFRLHYVSNEGIAFGLLHSLQSDWKPLLLSLAALLALGIVFHYIWSTPAGERRLFLAFGLLAGGILGNFTDRLLNGFVVDFLELHWKEQFIWPTFNLADAAITCGVVLILLDTLFGQGNQEATKSSAPTKGASQESEIGLKARLQGPGFRFWLPPLQLPQLPSADCRLPTQLCLLSCLALLPCLAIQPTPSARQLVQSLQERYDQIQSLSAKFRQITKDRGITQQEEGILLMKRPGRMRWEYQVPRRKLFVSDGKKSYFYNVGAKQVVESELDLENRGSPLLFLMGRGRLLSDFEADFETGEEPLMGSNWLLRLTPRLSQIQPDYEYVLLEFDRSTLRIHRLSVIDPIGNRNDYILSEVQENLPIPEKEFRLKIPKGVERIVQ
ncbi:MAG: signal peptidase II [Acidobacteriota bacterium]